MKYISCEEGILTVQMSVKEFGAIKQALNEVTNGEHIEKDTHFMTRMGVTRDIARSMLDEMTRIYREDLRMGGGRSAKKTENVAAPDKESSQ